MNQDQIAAFFTFAFVAAATPGPSNFLVLSSGARAGIVGGIPCLVGVVAGMALLMGAAALGLGGLIKAAPTSLAFLKWVGSAFLLWLAWKVASAPPLAAQSSAKPVGFWGAFAFQWVNPKSWIVGASAAATYGATGAASAIERAALLGGVFAAAALPACALWLVSGAWLQRWLTNERRSRVFNVGMGLALAGSVLLVAL
jgi:threonine/homoserine/homoserine lactone efflux protein